MALKKCIDATANLHDDDVKIVTDAYDSYIETMDAKQAAEHAIDDAIESVKSEKKEYIDLFNETYPESLKEAGQEKDLSEAPVIEEKKPEPKKKVEMPFVPTLTDVVDLAQGDLFDVDNIPKEAAKDQVKDNFNVNYKHVEVGTLSVASNTVSSAEDAAHVLASIRKHGNETMMAIVLDKDSKIIHVIRHTKGLKGQSSVSIVELDAAVGATDGAKFVWFGHNHPSGLNKPSQADIGITKQLTKGLEGSEVSVQGHIILGEGKKAYKLTSTGSPIGEVDVKPGIRKLRVSVTEKIIRKNKRSVKIDLGAPDQAREYIKSLESDSGIILLNTQHQVIGVISLAESEMKELRNNGRIPRILKSIDSTNAAAAMTFSVSGYSLNNVNNYLAILSDFQVLDSFVKAGNEIISYASKGLSLGDSSKPFFSKQPENFTQSDTSEKTKPKKSISIKQLTKLIKIMQRDSSGTRFINFHIRETQEEAFGSGSVKEHGIIKGGFYSGSDEVVLVAENIKDVNDAITVIRHEVVGHYGLRQLLNKEGAYDKLLKRVYDARDGELKELYDWTAKAYPDLVEKGDIRGIADEMLARAAETKTDSNLLKKIYDEIIKLLNKIGLVFDGISRKEVDSLLRSSAANLRKGALASRRSYSPTTAETGKGGTTAYSRRPPNQEINDAPTDGNLGMPDETMTDKFVRLAQDSFNRIKVLQKTIAEQGGTVKTESDVYLAEERSSGKITKRLDDLEKKSLSPMLKLMKDNDITVDVLDSYLLAKHATERNKYIAEINDAMPDGGSGITNQEADDILEELSDKSTELEEIAEIIYSVNNQALDNLVSGGHMKQQEADDLKSQWEFYVPLKGKEGIDNRQGTGQGFSISGTGLKSAMGRGTGNISESPTAHSFAQAESIIVRTEKTKIGQALINLVRENPDPNFWTISQRTYQKFTDLFGEPFEGYNEVPDGLIEGIDYHRTFVITKEERLLAKEENRNPKKKVVYALDPNYKRRDDIFSVMVEGEELLVNIKDLVVMEQLKKMNSTQLNAVFAGIGTINRYLAMVNTALNPEFVITNFERDFQTAMVNLGGEQSAKTAAKVAKAIPGAIRGIWQSTFDTSGTSEWREVYDEMREEGGTVGFFGLEDIDTKVKQMKRKLSNNHGVLGRSKQGIYAVRDLILDANLSVENASRLAAYKIVRDESIANGMNESDAKARAASTAKNLTVNFNRKGELAPVLNSAYLFYNASIQGSFRMFTALKNKRVQKIVGGIAAASFGLAMFNRMMGGDDDDGIPYWDKISDYTKQTNLIFMVPDGSGEYYKVKLPYGYNVFSYTGTALHDLAYSKDKTIINTSLNLASAAMNAFNPIQGADLLDTVIPTFLKPAEQDMRNINFMGSPIKPEFKFDNYDRPESHKSYKSTNSILKDFTSALNEGTGGNETHSGLIDVSPEIIKHYTNWVTGGAGMFVARALGGAGKLITGEDIEAKSTPFLRTIKGNTGSFYDTDRFYKALSEVNAVAAQIKLYKGTDNYSEYKSDNNEVRKLAFKAKIAKNKISRVRDERDKAYLKEDRDLALEKSEEIRQLMMKFSMLYDDAIEAQQ